MNRPPIVQPQLAPVTSIDDHLPAVPASGLTAEAIRARLASQAGWSPEFPGDGGIFANREPAGAAVLVPLVQHADGLTLLLTRRTDHLRDHAGQISFPGGRVEPEDDGPVATALRETEEEIGLSRERIRTLGFLDAYLTGTGYRIVPVVALIEPPFSLAINHHEVDEAFETPLSFLLDPANHKREGREWKGHFRTYYAMPFEGRYIWGATAGMIRNLYERLAG